MDLSALNDKQREVVLHKDGPLLVLAGAGSGKTMAITNRIAYLMEQQGVNSNEILAITFTNKAATEMRERIEKLVGPKAKQMYVGTFHSMFAKFLRGYADRLGFTRSFSIVDMEDQIDTIKKAIDNCRYTYLSETLTPKNIHSKISRAKNELLDPETYVARYTDKEADIVADVWKEYQTLLRSNNSMDFDDILVNMVYILHQFDEVRTLLQDRFRYILVDEYQDTNHAQYEAVYLLANGHKNICVVGDDDQSIYSFRGADISNILNFEKDYPNVKVVRLEQNYRSTKHILDAANVVIAKNKNRKEKSLWTNQATGEKIIHYKAADNYDEARFVANEIKKQVEKYQLAYSDCAILYRASSLSRTIESVFREKNIPYKIYGGMRFYDRQEIKDVLAYLRLIVFPNDDLSFDRIINRPKRGIGKTTVTKIKELAQLHQISQIEVCKSVYQYEELARSSNKLSEFVELIERCQDRLYKNNDKLSDFVAFVEEETGLLQSIINEKENSKAVNTDRYENIKELLSEIADFEENYEDIRLAMSVLSLDEEVEEETDTSLISMLTTFLEQSALYTNMDQTVTDDDFVRVMTIHASKGLEFPVVFIVGFEEEIFPSRRSLNEVGGEEEERRLSYVAITRAKQRLYFTTSKLRAIYGTSKEYKDSRFITCIPDEYIKVIGTVHAPRKRNKNTPFSNFQIQQKQKPTNVVDFSKKAKTVINSMKRPKSQLEIDYEVGMKVQHPRFGAGVIESIEEIGNDQLLMIQFDMGIKKPMLGKQSKLTID